jgi:hypothetical protein
LVTTRRRAAAGRRPGDASRDPVARLEQAVLAVFIARRA